MTDVLTPLASPLRIVIVDDHDLIRLALRAIIAAAREYYELIGEAATVAEARHQLLELKPDIAMIDISIADQDGLDLIDELRADLPQTRFMVLSAHSDAVRVGRALKAGVCAYVLKNNVVIEIYAALQAIADGRLYLSPGLDQLPAIPILTPRQIDVLRGTAQGLSAKVLARELGISPKTVEFHKAELKRRLGVNDVASLALYAQQRGLLK